MDAIADLTPEGSRVISTNVVCRKGGNFSSDYIVKSLLNVREDDLFKIGPLFCDFGTDYLREVQKTTKENTERIAFLLQEQNKYIKKKTFCIPFVFDSSKDDDKENRLEKSSAENKKEPLSCGISAEESSNEIKAPMIERTESDEGSNKGNALEENVSVEEKSDKVSETLAQEFGWDSDQEPETKEEKITEVHCPVRFSLDLETTKTLEINLPLADSDPSKTDSEKETEYEYVSVYSSEIEKVEDSELPCSSKNVEKSCASKESPVTYRSLQSAPRFYTRRNKKPMETETKTKTVLVRSSSRDSGANVEIRCEEGSSKTSDDPNEQEPFFVISSVVGNADFVFTENPDEPDISWHGGNEEFDGNRSTITPKKTDDITKIKGWRKKQFARGKDFSEESRAGEISDSEDAAENFRGDEFVSADVVIKQEPPEEIEVVDSAFVCDSLDDFLDKEADLKINYEIPHLYAEVGIKLTSDEIVSRPKINESESGILKQILDDQVRDRPARWVTGRFDFPESKSKKSRIDVHGSGKRTDDRKMRDKCIRNLIDYRYHYVSSGGKLVKVAGSYDSRPIVGPEGRPGKLAVWGNKTKAFDDIFNDLMEDDEVNEERAADKSVVLLYNGKTTAEFPMRNRPETPRRGSIDDRAEPTPEIEKSPVSVPNPTLGSVPALSPRRPEIVECGIPYEEIPATETEPRVQCKLVGLTVYPAPYRPLPSVVQYHLRKLRSYRTKIDSEWANFAVSALDVNRDPRKRARMILPVFCPVLDSEKEPKKDYDLYCRQMLDPFRNGPYFKNFKNEFGNVTVPKEVRDAVNFVLETVEKSTERRSPTKGCAKRKRGKGRASNINMDQIISSDEKRTRKIPGKFKDTTILEEKIFPLALRSCDFSSPSVTVSDCSKKPYSRRWHEKIRDWQKEYDLKECKVVMHRMKGLSRVAPWCMKHECYSCQNCRLKNPFSSKFFKFSNGKRKRPSSSWNKNIMGFSRNVALKRTAPRSHFFLRQDVYPVPVPDEKGELGRNFLLPFKNIFPDTEEEKEKEKKRLTLESVFEEEERTRIADPTRTVRQITFNKVVTKLLSEKLKDLKSTKTITGSIDDLRNLRQNVIELIKLNFVKESFSCGYINIWYLRGKTASKSRAFLTFSKYPPVEGAINLKSGVFSARDLPKVITEIVSEKGRFDCDDYAILHCDGSLWEIHGSVNFTVEKSEELERPIEETKIVYADEVIVSELRFMTRLHPGKIFDNPAKWWIMDLSQEYLEILAKVDGQVFKFTREDIMTYAEIKVSRFVNIGRSGSPIFGAYIIPSVLPYGLIGPYHLHENHGLELKIHEKTIPFIYTVPGSNPPVLYPDVVPSFTAFSKQVDVPFGIKHLIGQTISDFDANHKSVIGMWLHDKTVKKEPSFLEIQTKLKKMPPPAISTTKIGYDLSLEHDYSLSLRRRDSDSEGSREVSTFSRTISVDQYKNRSARGVDDFEDEEPEFTVYLVPDIPNLGYIRGQLMSDHSITIRHPLTPSKLINSLKMDEWLNNFLKQKIQFIPNDLKVTWRTVTDVGDLGDEKSLNKFCLGGTHILCQKGLFYMLSMNKTMLEKLGLDKSDVLKAISDSTIIKEVMEVKELGKLVTMESECNLSISEVLGLAIKEIKGLEARSEELIKIKMATEKKKQKLCRQYTETLKSCKLDDESKRKLFLKVKNQLLAIQAERRKTEGSQKSAKPAPKKRSSKKGETLEAVQTSKSVPPIPEKKEIIQVEKSEPKPKPKPKSRRGGASVIDNSKIRTSPPISTVSEEQISLAEEEEDEGCGIKIIDVQSMAPPQPEDDVPRVATEEIVSTAEEVPFVPDFDIKKLETKLANVYRLLRSKTRPEDVGERERLLTRLTTISRQLDKIKGVVSEIACSTSESPEAEQVQRHAISRPSLPTQTVRPVLSMPQIQQMQARPMVLTNPMQPIYLIMDQPLVSAVESQTTPVSAEQSPSDNAEENSKYISPLESAVFNGNQKFKIERKYERAKGRERERQYVVHKPYFSHAEGNIETLESGVHYYVDETDSRLPTISNVRSLRKPSEDDSTDAPEFPDVKSTSNFLISVSKESGKKICIVRNKRSEEPEDEVFVNAPDRQRSTRAEFIPLTSLNSSRNLTVRRQETIPSEAGKTKCKPSILKSVLIRRPTSVDVSSEALTESDSSESRERTENGIDVDVPESEEEKKRKSLSTGMTVRPSKKSKSEKGDSDEETSWLTMNTEDIEKNFQKLIEPIIQTDRTVENKTPSTGF